MKLRESALMWLPLALAGLLLDQITKYTAVTYLQLGDSIPVFPGFSFSLVYNYGAAFGFLNQGEGWQQWFFMVLALTASSIFIFWLGRVPRTNYCEGLGITLLLSGAVGNLIDRFNYGYVIDFIDIYVSTWHWPAFNLADTFICVGATLVMHRLLHPLQQK